MARGIQRTSCLHALRRDRLVSARTQPPFGDVPTADYLHEQFDAGRSVDDIAAHLGCTPSTVETAANRHGVTRRGQHPQLDDLGATSLDASTPG